MASSRILDSRYFDKLVVNRLDAQEIKSGTSGPSGPSGPSYLFSLLLKDATFKPNTTGGTLTFDLPLHSNDNVIMFSDRPFRQTSFISFTEFISAFTSDNSNNSFEKDPPNAVLVHSEEQRTYIVRYSSKDSSSDSSNSSTVTFNLELLAGETNVSLEVISGRMNLFVDPFNFGDFAKNVEILYGELNAWGVKEAAEADLAAQARAVQTQAAFINNVKKNTDTSRKNAYNFIINTTPTMIEQIENQSPGIIYTLANNLTSNGENNNNGPIINDILNANKVFTLINKNYKYNTNINNNLYYLSQNTLSY